MNENKEYFVKEDDFIVSKTDVKGKITYCNQPFLKIVGATQEQLLFKPHDIIRHPDMPRIVFKLLWDRIKASRKFSHSSKTEALTAAFTGYLLTSRRRWTLKARSSAITPSAASQTQTESNLSKECINSCLMLKKAAA